LCFSFVEALERYFSFCHELTLRVAATVAFFRIYSISVAVTIEPGRFKAEEDEEIPAPSRRLCGVQEVQGYFLPDPSTPNRLTVWFTGGKLSPTPPPESADPDEYGDFDEWKKVFGGNHKRTWGESLSVMGAKVFLGAELPNGMDQNGSLSYTLHRPAGGHGKGYVDVSTKHSSLLTICKSNLASLSWTVI